MHISLNYFVFRIVGQIIATDHSMHALSAAQRQNFLLIAQLHLRDSRSPHRSANLTFRPAPLRSSARFKWFRDAGLA